MCERTDRVTAPFSHSWYSGAACRCGVSAPNRLAAVSFYPGPLQGPHEATAWMTRAQDHPSARSTGDLGFEIRSRSDNQLTLVYGSRSRKEAWQEAAVRTAVTADSAVHRKVKSLLTDIRRSFTEAT